MKTTCIKHIGDSLFRLVADGTDIVIYRVVELLDGGPHLPRFRAEVIETCPKCRGYIGKTYHFYHDVVMYKVDICGQPVSDT